MYNHTITIINLFNNRGRTEEYIHVLEGVHFQDKQGVRTGNTEHFTDNQGYVQIPHSVKGYLPPNEWLKSNEKNKYWTLKEQDLIVKGTDLNNPVKDTYGIRLIDSIENIDYGIFIPNHYGVTLV